MKSLFLKLVGYSIVGMLAYAMIEGLILVLLYNAR